MATANLRKLAEQWASPAQASIESLTNLSGFLKVAETIEASNDLWHKHKNVNSLPSFSAVPPGGSIGDTTVSSDVLQTDLKTIKAHQSESADIVENWKAGKAAYFDAQRPSYLEAYGQKVSNLVFYGDDATFGDVAGFRGLHQFAKAYGNEIAGSGTSGSTTTIFAVKFRSGVNGCGMLFDNQVMGGADIMKSTVLNPNIPVLEVTNTTGNQKKEVYQVVHKGTSSFLTTSTYDVARYHSLQDDTSDRPTARNLNALIDLVRGESSNTFLFMNRLGRRLVNDLKTTDLQTNVMDTDYNIVVDMFNGIRIILDDNISSVETDALD